MVYPAILHSYSRLQDSRATWVNRKWSPFTCTDVCMRRPVFRAGSVLPSQASIRRSLVVVCRSIDLSVHVCYLSYLFACTCVSIQCIVCAEKRNRHVRVSASRTADFGYGWVDECVDPGMQYKQGKVYEMGNMPICNHVSNMSKLFVFVHIHVYVPVCPAFCAA